ncbi:MAG: DUF1214 domain-containing protein [Sphingobium sp.]
MTNEKDSHSTPWSGLMHALQGLDTKLIAKLPARLRHDPQMMLEATRLMLAALGRMVTQAIAGDREHPVFLPALNIAFNVFQPNADTVYRYALIDPAGTYRIVGKRGTVRVAAISQTPLTIPELGVGRPRLADHDLDDLTLDKDGGFSVLLSPTRPEGHQGDWWQLDPATMSLGLRQVAYDWSVDDDPTVSIERLDTPAASGRRTAADLQRRLVELPTLIGNTALFFLDHVEELRAENYINQFKIFDVSQMGGLSGQFYYECAYELRDDEALVLETDVPVVAPYWSVILTNDLYETTDWYNNHSSLNGAQAHVDADGKVRIVISAKDPGVRNWLDIAGYPTGAVQGRWLNCSDNPIPTLRKVAVSEIGQYVPSDTARVSLAEREAIIRARRSALQQRRRLW